MLPTGQVSCRPVFFLLFFGGGGEDSPPPLPPKKNQLVKLIRPGGPSRSVAVFNASFALIVPIVHTFVRHRKPCYGIVIEGESLKSSPKG